MGPWSKRLDRVQSCKFSPLAVVPKRYGVPAVTEQQPRESSAGEPLTEDVDYYIENGLYVFTEHYLLKRGYCCQSGCRHCPYGFQIGKYEQNNKGGC